MVDLVDIGTGSGCIAVTLSLEESNFNVIASDIDADSLEVAKKNASNLGANVEFRQGNMLEPILGSKFDIIVSNPPYIPVEENVDLLVKDNEPHVALFGGADGLDFYKIIITGSVELIKDKFMIAFEHGFDQGERIRNLAKETYPNAHIFTMKDLQGKERMTFIKGVK